MFSIMQEKIEKTENIFSENNLPNINKRIKSLIEYYTNGSVKRFSEMIQLSSSQKLNRIFNIDKRSGQYPEVSSDILLSIANMLSDINTDWLLKGQGDMIKEKVIDNAYISETIKQEVETRPRIPMDAAAGSLTVAPDGITLANCEQLPLIKAFSRYDFTIFARGDSMLPEYHSGDELACLYIKDTSFIQWGCCHVLDTVQGIIVKRIYDDGEYILCRSENSGMFADFKIKKTEVYNIALVIGLIRRY